MLDPLIDLTCLRCGRPFRLRASVLADPAGQDCDACSLGRRPRASRPFRWRGWWRRLRRALFKGEWTY